MPKRERRHRAADEVHYGRAILKREERQQEELTHAEIAQEELGDKRGEQKESDYRSHDRARVIGP